jgi:hypothetical protein
MHALCKHVFEASLLLPPNSKETVSQEDWILKGNG